MTIMVARTSDRTPTPRRCDCAEHLRRVADTEATGSRDFGRGFMHAAKVLDGERIDYRARCLLALSLVNQRATDTGLCWADAATVKAALEGVWDERPGGVG